MSGPRLTSPRLASVDHESVEAARLDLARISRLVAAFAASQSRAAALATPAAPAAPATSAAAPAAPAAGRVARRPGPLRRFGLLLRRAWRQNVRDAWTNGLRLGVRLAPHASRLTPHASCFPVFDLQPHVREAATPRVGGCNPMCPR